ncbi:MAG: hypothetical protein AAGG38_08450 [Planctomycetota bacterium]
MFDFLKLLIDWKQLLEVAGFDAVIYAALALVGTLLFALRMGLSLILGLDSDVDLDAGGEGGGFGLISVLSITAFLMGTGWMGLVARLEWDLSPTASALFAAFSGATLMVLASGMMFVLQRAAHHVEYNPATAIGHVGTVYMAIPARGMGNGQVRVAVQGRSVLVDAISTGEAIESFRDVKVVDTRDEKTLIVEPA